MNTTLLAAWLVLRVLRRLENQEADRLAGALLAPGTGLGGRFVIGAAAYDRERDCFAAEGRLTCSAGETVPPAGEAFDRFEVTAGIE